MQSNENNKNRGAHGDSLRMLGEVSSSNKNPPALAVGSVKGLPPLFATDLVEPQGYWIGAHGHDKAKRGMSKRFRDQKTRSKTFWGIARAMASQWGGDIREKKGDEIPDVKFGSDES